MILYASVTGKAESIASLIAEESEKRNLNFTKKCLCDVTNIDLSKEKCVVIISSTTGDGEQPEKALPFLKKLKSKEICEKKLRDLKYTILGLGDSNYSQFCNGPKSIHEKLLSLEAKPFYEPAWADDGVGLEIIVEPWLDGLWGHLKEFEIQKLRNGSVLPSNLSNLTVEHKESINPTKYKLDLKAQFDQKLNALTMEELTEKLGGIFIETKQNDILKDLVFPIDTTLTLPSCPSSYLKLGYLEAESGLKNNDTEEKLYHLQDKKLIEVAVKNGIKMSKSGSVKSCYQVTLDFQQNFGNVLIPEFLPGDAVDIVCSNPKTEVDSVLERMGILNKLADNICVSASLLPDCKKSAKIPVFLPKNGELFSLRHIITNCVEIRSVVKKPFIRMLVDFTSNKLEQRRLEELCSRQGGNNYLSVIRGNNVCLLDILLAFPSCRPPIGNN